jgi:hypothetical protein
MRSFGNSIFVVADPGKTATMAFEVRFALLVIFLEYLCDRHSRDPNLLVQYPCSEQLAEWMFPIKSRLFTLRIVVYGGLRVGHFFEDRPKFAVTKGTVQFRNICNIQPASEYRYR